MKALRHGSVVAAIALCVALGGCANLVGRVTSGLAADLSATILDSEDPALVRDGAPAYLILLDALLRDGGENADLLRGAASLNSAYATAFLTDEKRAKAFADKAFDFAFRAACLDIAWMCDARKLPFDELDRRIQGLEARDVPAAYALATAWAGWIQAHSADYSAIADLGRVKPLMARVLELDEAHDHGGPHLYMGVFETVIPPAVGGRPEIGREHFERAQAIAGGRHLMAKVLLAENYARVVFDRELHDRVLREVLAAEIRAPGLTLMNAIAQQQAQGLLESADEYF
jgi:hypothetical protein